MRTRALLALPALLLAGCRVGPDHVVPELQLPDAWEDSATAGLEEGTAELETWWTVFADPTLEELIDRAREGNLDLVVAAQRIEEARALRRVAVADRIPTVDLNGSAGRTQFSNDILPGIGATDQYSLTFDAAWEVDVWGRVARQVEAADAGIQASEEDYRDVLVLLYAEVALEYVSVRSLQARIAAAERNAETQRGTLQLTKDRFDAQIVPELDIRQAELNLARTEAAVPALRARLWRTLNRIGTLLGETPHAVRPLLEEPAAIPLPPEEVVAGIPADVLRKRPDIRASERALASQVARIGVATADLYPRFAITGSFGWNALSGSSMFSSDSQSWSVGVPFSWNLLDRGRIKGVIAAEEARANALQADYERTVLGALEEVESSLSSFGEEKLRRELLAQSVVAAERSVELVQTLYTNGLADFQNVLDMERSLAEQSDALAESEGLVASNLIRLYRALGGGWAPDAPVPLPRGADAAEPEEPAETAN
jgi:NodT family efflux transporter outer membrane factor (OMF) lipoprotein